MAMALGAVVLIAAAWLRGAEYDEQYTLFLTAGTPRPVWPQGVFAAGTATAIQAGHATLAGIATDLRATDVHPPIYFWAISLWRDIFGPGLFTARLFSVLCGLASLVLVARIARRCAISPASAILLTCGCYGFVYTNAIARGFAPAETATLCGIDLLLARRPVLAGVAFGVACGCNYLAVFVAIAACLAARAWQAAPAAAPFLAMDAWFLAAQHAARPGQFPPFELWPSLIRLAGYQVAAVFGALPLYVEGPARVAAGAAVALGTLALIMRGMASNRQTKCPQPPGPAQPVYLSVMARLVPATHDVPFIARARAAMLHQRALTAQRRLLLAAAVASPLGLLALGAIFSNTPIELRYLSFGLPFIALLAAKPVPPHPEPVPTGQQQHRAQRHTSLLLGPPTPSLFLRGKNLACSSTAPLTFLQALQLTALAGLLLAPSTMQPARRAATQAAAYAAADALVLLPAGNDGVGIVGAFATESPPAQLLLLVRPTAPPITIPPSYHRVILALLAQDHDSTATLPIMRAAVAGPDWLQIVIGSNVEVYERAARPPATPVVTHCNTYCR